MRRAVEEAAIAYAGASLSITASFGVCTLAKESLQAMVNAADDLLYQAKNLGRNRVIRDR